MVKIREEEVAFLQSNRVARLGTVSDKNIPHVVPICYVYLDNGLYVPVDLKMARKKTNIEKNRKVCLTIDEYSEDWSKLKGLAVQGEAKTIERGEEFIRVRDLIYEKYPQFKTMFPIKEGSHWIVRIAPKKVASWGIK